MNLLTRKRIYQIQKTFLSVAVFFLMLWNVPVWSEVESPLPLPKAEGSKSFDLEISQINSLAIKEYQQGLFDNAADYFKKARIGIHAFVINVAPLTEAEASARGLYILLRSK